MDTCVDKVSVGMSKMYVCISVHVYVGAPPVVCAEPPRLVSLLRSAAPIHPHLHISRLTPQERCARDTIRLAEELACYTKTAPEAEELETLSASISDKHWPLRAVAAELLAKQRDDDSAAVRKIADVVEEQAGRELRSDENKVCVCIVPWYEAGMT